MPEPISAARRRAFLARRELVPARVRLRRLQRLWAVCQPDGSITFARAVLDQAIAFQGLVISHELVHLRIRDHGEYFQLMLELLQPDRRAVARLAPPTPAGLKSRFRVEESTTAATGANWVMGTRYSSLTRRAFTGSVTHA